MPWLAGSATEAGTAGTAAAAAEGAGTAATAAEAAGAATPVAGSIGGLSGGLGANMTPAATAADTLAAPTAGGGVASGLGANMRPSAGTVGGTTAVNTLPGGPAGGGGGKFFKGIESLLENRPPPMPATQVGAPATPPGTGMPTHAAPNQFDYEQPPDPNDPAAAKKKDGLLTQVSKNPLIKDLLKQMMQPQQHQSPEPLPYPTPPAMGFGAPPPSAQRLSYLRASQMQQ